MKMTNPIPIVISALALFIAGCSARIGTDVAQQCSEELKAAEAELDKAKADGLSEAVSITKAASLIAAAAIQKQFEKYEGCTDKSQRARAFIADAQKK